MNTWGVVNKGHFIFCMSLVCRELKDGMELLS